ncbi:Peptidase S1 domain-containing protein [Aphelenchoides besseyi]|nr:Peptidase S1 domain-containing protein [Aphelenchoides besseyi]
MQVLFFIKICLFTVVSSYDSEFMYYAAPGKSPYFDKLSKSENENLQQTCGISSNKTAQLMIENGDYVTHGQIPWAASISAANRIDLNTRCGAAIISPRHLLSATHCFFHYSVKQLPCKDPVLTADFNQLKVSFGGVCLRKDKKCKCKCRDVRTLKVRRLAILRSFHSAECQSGNDLAIIELEHDIKFGNDVQPVCLVDGPILSPREKKKETMKHVHSLQTVGWGMSNDQKFPARLRHFQASYYYQQSFLDSDILQLSSDKNVHNGKRSGICSGDSGGGTVGYDNRKNRSVLVGVHSYAESCQENKQEPSAFYAITFAGDHLQQICYITGVCTKGIN